MAKHFTRKMTDTGRKFDSECRVRREMKRRETTLDTAALARELHMQQMMMTASNPLGFNMA